MTKPKELTTMDKAHAFLFGTKTDGVPRTTEVLSVQHKLRAKLRSAQKFVLDDDSVRLICNLSREFDRMEGWSFLARLPYDTMWIELDCHVKVTELASMGVLETKAADLNDVSKRLGYLMYREEPDNPASSRWIAHGFSEGDYAGQGVMISLFTYVFDPEGGPQFPVRGSSTWGLPTLSMVPGFPKATFRVADPTGFTIKGTLDPELVLAGMYIINKGSYDLEDALNGGEVHHGMVSAPAWLGSRLAVTIEPWWWAALAKYATPERRAVLYEPFMIQLSEDKGVMRWLITMLAAINGLPKAVKPANVRTSKHTVGMYQLPYFGHSNLSVTIPREDRVIRARKILDRLSRNARRRWHQVIGHWRIIEYGKKPTHICRHAPVMVEHNVGRCENCGLMVRWIPSFGRGDATIGVVDHEYKVRIK